MNPSCGLAKNEDFLVLSDFSISIRNVNFANTRVYYDWCDFRRMTEETKLHNNV